MTSITTPQPGVQTSFLSSAADITIMGGGIGSGKTTALLLAPLQHVASNRDFTAHLLRRDRIQITNPTGAGPISHGIYEPLGALYDAKGWRWVWPDGGKVQFGDLQGDQAAQNYAGIESSLLLIDEVQQLNERQF